MERHRYSSTLIPTCVWRSRWRRSRMGRPCRTDYIHRECRTPANNREGRVEIKGHDTSICDRLSFDRTSSEHRANGKPNESYCYDRLYKLAVGIHVS